MLLGACWSFRRYNIAVVMLKRVSSVAVCHRRYLGNFIRGATPITCQLTRACLHGQYDTQSTPLPSRCLRLPGCVWCSWCHSLAVVTHFPLSQHGTLHLAQAPSHYGTYCLLSTVVSALLFLFGIEKLLPIVSSVKQHRFYVLYV